MWAESEDERYYLTWKTLKKTPKFYLKTGRLRKQPDLTLISVKVRDEDEAVTGYTTWEILIRRTGGTDRNP